MNGEVKKTRSDSGVVQVTTRDLYALTWISEQYAITFDQLRRLLGQHAKAHTKTPDRLSVSATRNALERWQRLGYIETRKILAEHTPYIWLSRKGLSSLHSAYPYYEPRPSTASHIGHVNDARLHLQTRNHRSIWTPKRVLRAEAPKNQEHISTLFLPDGELFIGTWPIAIEVFDARSLSSVQIHTIVHALLPCYRAIWCFLYSSAFTDMYTVLASLSREQQTKVMLFALEDMEEIKINLEVNTG